MDAPPPPPADPSPAPVAASAPIPVASALPRALDAPQLSMSTDRVLRCRRFGVTLTMGAAIAAQYSEFDVMRAGLSAKCRREDDLSTNITSCFCSGGKRVVEIGISSKAAFGPNVSADGLVTYTFDNCRSNCSSSRDHHKSRLMLVVDELPGRQLILSSSFVLQAREKQIRNRSHKRQTTASQVNDSDSSEESVKPPAVIASSPPESPEPLAKRAKADTSQLTNEQAMLALVACAGEEQKVVSPPQQQPAAQQQLALVPYKGEPVVRRTVPMMMPLFAEPSPLLKMMVRVHTTAITTPAVDNLLEVFAPRVRGMNGFCGYRWRALPGFAVTFSMFEDTEGAFNSLAAAKRFIHNTDENPYHCDLADTSILCLISYCTSW